MKRIVMLLFVLLPVLGFSQTHQELMDSGLKNYNEGKYKAALTDFLNALDKAKTDFGEESIEVANSLNALGVLYDEVGMYEKGVSYYLPSLEIKKKLLGTENASYALAVNNLGIAYTYMGNYLEAEKYVVEGMQIRKRVLGPKDELYASSINSVAYIYQHMNRFDEAEKLFFESLGIYEGLFGKKSRNYAQVLNNLGYFYMETGRFNESEKVYLESIDIYAQVVGTNHPDYGNALMNLGALYAELGSHQQSLQLYEKAKVIVETRLGKDHPDYANILNNMARSQSELGMYAEAEKNYTETLDHLKSTERQTNPYYAIALGNLAIVYSRSGKYMDAANALEEAGKIFENTVGTMHPSYASNLVALAALYHRAGVYEKADSFYTEAIKIREAIYDPNNMDLATLRHSSAALNWHTNNYEKAKKLFLASIQTLTYQVESQSAFLSETEMGKFLHDNRPLFAAFYSFSGLNAAKDPSIVSSMNKLNSVLNGKLLKNANQLKFQIAESNDSNVVKKYDEWLGLKKSINKEMSLPTKYRSKYLGDWEKEAGELEKELTRSVDGFEEQEQPQSDWKKIKSQLKPGDGLIEFISYRFTSGDEWSDSTVYGAMVTRPQDSIPIYVSLFEERNLKGLFTGDTLRTFANLLYTEAQIRTIEDHDISYGDSLYQLIWKPLYPYIKDLRNVYYVPSGLLHNIAHNAIPLEGKLISDQFHLNQLMSSEEVASTSGNFSISSIAMLGGIDYELDTTSFNSDTKKQRTKTIFNSKNIEGSRGGTSWNYLPGAKKEVQSIGELLKTNKIKAEVYTDKTATEELVKDFNGKSSPSVIHFSTHGFFFPDPKEELNKNVVDEKENPFTTANDPLFRSGLILYGGNYVWKGNQPVESKEDGILTAYEVSNLHLPNTKLVIMSACETGLGDIKGSEGVYGLQRAFKMAGVDYIIVTLWQVLDKETSEFMILFYQNLLNQKSIPLAFKTTQDTMKNKYREEPYKWAGFVLIN